MKCCSCGISGIINENTKLSLGARGFPCAVSGIGHAFPSAAREKKPLVPRVLDRTCPTCRNDVEETC